MTYTESLSAIGAAADAEVASLTAALTAAKAQNLTDAATIARLEQRIAELTNVTPPPVDPPPVTPPTTGAIPWAPPAGYAGFTRFTIPSAGGTVTIPAGVDALLVAPNVVTGPVTIKGGRNRVLIGARLGGRKTSAGHSDSGNRGIRLSDGDDAGRDWIEGVYGEAGTYFSDFVQIAIRTNNNRDVDLVNLRNDGITYGTQAGVHADVVQCWGGPRCLRVWGLTARNVEYQGFYLDCADGRALPAAGAPWRFERVNLIGVAGKTRYLYANREPSYTRATASDVWITGSPYNNADSFGNAPAGVKVGTVADFVPASLWTGAAYTSPGYAA